jgi:hypothetical protein
VSIQAIRWAVEQRAGSASAKAVLLALAEAADRSGVARVGQRRLVAVTELGERTVRDALAALEERELVEREHRYRKGGSRTTDEIRLRIPADAAGEGEAYRQEPPVREGGIPAAVAPLVPTVLEPTTPPCSPPAGGRHEEAEPPKPDPFEEAWSLYPSRAGGNSKKLARKAWDARIRERVTPAEMILGVKRYAAYVRGTDREGTEFVKQAATFFGPAEHWREEWRLPARAGPNGSNGGNGTYQTPVRIVYDP